MRCVRKMAHSGRAIPRPCATLFPTVFQDVRRMVYQGLEVAARIVFASPIQFMTVSAQVKMIINGLQALWARKYVLRIRGLSNEHERKGLFISVGGRRVANLFELALATVRAVFHTLNIIYAGDLLYTGIDKKEAITEQPDALKQAFLAGQRQVIEI